jgi:hypothetical protein
LRRRGLTRSTRWRRRWRRASNVQKNEEPNPRPGITSMSSAPWFPTDGHKGRSFI